MQVIPNEEYSDYNITMNVEAIGTIKEMSNVFLLDGIRSEIVYELSCANSLEFSIEMKNTTQKTLECNFENSSVESTRRGRAVEYELVSPKENVILLPGQKKRVSFIFNISDKEDPRPNSLNMRAVINGKKVEFSVYIENDEYDF